MRWLLTVFMIFSMLALNAQPVLPLIPSTGKNDVNVADIWLNGGTPSATNMGSDKAADSFSGRILRVLSNEAPAGELTAKYDFQVKKGGKYAFYAALARQGTPYASPVEFRFDGGKWQAIPKQTKTSSCWGISSAVTWESLGDIALSSGAHALEFRVAGPAANGMWSFMCDGITGWLTDADNGGKVNCQAAIADGKLMIKAASPTRPGLVEVDLAMGPDSIIRQTVLVTEKEKSWALPLPSFLGANSYRLTFRNVWRPEQVLATETVTIPRRVAVSPIVALNGAKVDFPAYEVTLQAPAQSKSVIAVWLFVGDELQGVDNIPVAAGATVVKGTLTDGLQRLAAGRTVKLRFLVCPGRGEGLTENISVPGQAAQLGKPLNYGLFRDADGQIHPWYMSRDFNYVFDGQVYQPFGGMWCAATPGGKGNDLAAIEKRLAHDMTVAGNLVSAGINDVYLNLACVAPLWVRQAFVDKLEQHGINFGYQLSSGGGPAIPSFFITRDRQGVAKWQGVIRGTYRDGKVTALLPKTYKVSGMLVLPDGRPGWCRLISFADQEGKDQRHGIIDLETVQNFNDTHAVTFPVDLPAANGETVIIIPRLDAKMAHANLWDPRQREQLQDRFSWIKEINWSSNLRFFVDPICNETNMVNTTENLRQYTPYINQDFARWLEQKYKTVGKLNQAWATELPDFATASRLVPLRLDSGLYLADPECGKVYRATPEHSQSWLDYNTMIRETYAGYADELAMFIKRMVNVPVINKSVGCHGSPELISRRYLGWDGTGFEIYGGRGLPIGSGGATLSEAHASSHTMWKVGTEIGHSAAAGNDGVKFFKDENEIRQTADNLSKLGINGFYFFGIDLQPAKLWGKHSFHDFPAGMQWVSRIKHDYQNGGKPAAVAPSYAYPGGYGWWWWITRNQAVYGQEQNQIPLTVRLRGDEWACNTDVLPDDGQRVVVSCPKPPFSRYHADRISALLNSGRKVIYLGGRIDLGTINGLDDYFTGREIKFKDGSTAQELRQQPGATVLAAESGRIWALAVGNLTIVSRSPVKEYTGDQNRDTGFKYLDPTWLK